MKIIICFVLSFFFLCSFSQNKKKTPDTIFIKQAFAKADDYIGIGKYDSAQEWLNKIHQTLPSLTPTLFNYKLLSRQAEVYYYNRLPKLGLQEAQRGLKIAQQLHDSMLIADSYNFLGLFYIGLDSNSNAAQHFINALKFSVPYSQKLMEENFTSRHHIYGNLAELYENREMYDSALYFAKRSLEQAELIQADRGMAMALVSIGQLFAKKNNCDSAFYYLEKGAVIANNKMEDIILFALVSYADCYKKTSHSKALSILDSGINIIKKQPEINEHFKLIFLNRAKTIYKELSDENGYTISLELLNEIQNSNIDKYNTQTQNIINAGFKNETQVLQLQVNTANQKQEITTTRLYIAILLILLVIAGFLIYNYFTKQKLRIAEIRNKISQDLHDEVGATLSGIAMYSHILKMQMQNKQEEKADTSLNVIQTSASEMVTKLNDIVWSVNPDNDSINAIIQKLKDFSVQLAASKNIKLTINSTPELSEKKLSMKTRQNIYMICKEAINNALKYSEATSINVNTMSEKAELIFKVSDNGKGFNIEKAILGNGIKNMRNRVEELNGTFNINSDTNGTTVTVTCKIP